MALTIKTDNKWRNLLYGYELPKKQRKEFDYLTDEEFETRNFVKYRGNYYDMDTFMLTPKWSALAEWDGYASDSYFSGVVIKISSNMEQYKIGRYYS
jgi:hypothetical protein